MLNISGSHSDLIISYAQCGFWQWFTQSYRSWYFRISSLNSDNCVFDILLGTLKMSWNSIFDDTPRFSSSIYICNPNEFCFPVWFYWFSVFVLLACLLSKIYKSFDFPISWVRSDVMKVIPETITAHALNQIYIFEIPHFNSVQ